ncbi:MAG: hypothetical protein DRI71_03140 [Bacteroidetes bacterium]|nr:MAG: hypothetical protein DRI71_03140 [Bacteroidota bacterium]
MNIPRILLILAFFSLTKSFAQQTETGNLFAKIETIISNMPGSSGNDYNIPDANQLETWGEVMSHLLNEEYALADSKASSIGYELIEFTDNSTSKIYYILANTSTNYWGTYVFNPQYLIPLVIQSPHPRFDTNTGLQGIYVFEETDALFYCVSGTHRCNNSTTTSCSGTTSVCGTSGAYKISDMAHNTNNVFQNVTDTLFTHYDSTYFVSLHGFAKRDSDPYVILSNGTRDYPETDYISRFKSKLLLEDNSLTFQIAHVNTGWTRLIAFTNTQGRLINGSVDPCDTDAVTAAGRFMHMEQEKSKLRNDESGWRKVANALRNTFTDQVTGINNERFPKKVSVYPNPGSKLITITNANKMPQNISVYTLLNKDMTSSIEITLSGTNLVIDVSELPQGIYILRTGLGTKKIFIQ